MSKKVTIKTRTVGQAFATDAVVMQGRKKLHVTNDYPYGLEQAARTAAESWAEKNGYTVAAR